MPSTWARGWNNMGQLGLGHRQRVDKFTRMAALEGRRVVSLSSEMAQSAAVLDDGQVLLWGYTMDRKTMNKQLNWYKNFPWLVSFWQCYAPLGQTFSLRLGSTSPSLINKHLLQHSRMTRVKVGNCSLTCIDENGCLYALGQNYFGQLGIGDTKYREILECTWPNNDVLDFSNGNLHSVLVNSAGDVFGAGSLRFGQIFSSQPNQKVSDIMQRYSPMLSSRRISKVQCGHNYTFMYSQIQNKLYACGKNRYGQVGISHTLGDLQSGIEEIALPLDLGEHITQIAAGFHHTLVLTDCGRLMFFGCHIFGQCPFRTIGNGLETIGPHFVQWPRKVDRIWAGINQSAVKDETGLWLWGQGDSQPRLQEDIEGEVEHVGLGFNFVIACTN